MVGRWTVLFDNPQLVEELVDPSTDPLYVQIFTEMANDEVSRLHTALDALAGGEVEESIQEIAVITHNLMHAAERMGYDHLVALLGDLDAVVEGWDSEAQITELKRLGLALSQELAAIQGVAPSTGSGQARSPEPEKSVQPSPRGPSRDRLVEQLQKTVSEALTIEPLLPDEDIVYEDIFDAQPSQRPLRSSDSLSGIAGGGAAISDLSAVSDAARVFKQWCAVRACDDLARLDKIMDELEQFVRQFLAGSSGLMWDEKLALVNEAAYLLRAIYQACVFYKLEQAAHLTLAMEDLYVRVAQEEMRVDEALLDLTRAYVTQLRHAIESIRGGETPELAALADLLGQTKEMLYLHSESHISQATMAMLDLLNLPPEFKEVVTPENLLEISRALQAGESFYTVLADLNYDGEVGQSFYRWSKSDTVRLITNVTVFQDKRSLYNFLLATSESRESILETFAGMDPQGRYLSLEECSLREGVNLEEAVSDQVAREPVHRTGRVVEAQGAVSMEALTGFVEKMGELVATRATLHRVVERLTEVDLIETAARLVKQSGYDWQRVRRELQISLGSWINDLGGLAQLETEMGAVVDQFQEVALALRARPAAEILDPLQRLIQNVAQHQGKMVKLDIEGANVGLDHSAMDILADPIHRLAWFAVAHGIEKPVQRLEAGKQATGRVSVAVSKIADHVQVVIEDDGRGIDPDATLGRARELGWANDDSIPADKLSEWVLREGFGLVGGSHCYDVEGIDLAAINADLQARRGRLSVASEPGQGTRLSLDIPLDTVVIDGMVMRAGDVHYVVPIEVVRRIVKPEETHLVHSSADGGQRMLRLDEELVPIQTLAGNTGGGISQESLLLVVETGERGVALAVDELIGQQQVLVQPLQGCLTDIQSVSGCAMLGEGDVGMVLDINRVTA